MDQDEQALQQLKAKMTADQRKNMAEIISSELKRRESMKMGTGNTGVRLNTKKFVASAGMNGGLDSDAMRDVYGQTSETIRNLRLQKIDEQLNKVRKAKGGAANGGIPAGLLQSAGITPAEIAAARSRGGRKLPRIGLAQALMILGVIALGGAKFLLSSTGADAGELTRNDARGSLQMPDGNLSTAQKAETPAAEIKPVQPTAVAPRFEPLPAPVANKIIGSSPAETKVLTELDARRVELEKRKALLDKKEAELAGQSQALNERMAELKGLVARLSDVRHEKDQQYDARMEQLSNVYGAMDPKEAAPLISKLDLDISIPLLERLPGKRMGQILALMDRDRAIELTRRLTAK